MSASPRHSLSRSLQRGLPFLGLWLAGLALMYHHSYVFSYETITREIDPVTSMSYGLPFVTAEVLVLYLILRPNTFHHSWGRSLVAFLSFTAWTACMIQFVMHSPGWYLGHVWWLLVVTCCLLLLVLGCLMATLIASRTKGST